MNTPARPDAASAWTVPTPRPDPEGTGRPTAMSRLAVVAVVIGAVSLLAQLSLFVVALSELRVPRLPAALYPILELLRVGGALLALKLGWTAIQRIELTNDKRGLFAAHLARTLAIVSLALLAVRWVGGWGLWDILT